MSGVAATMPQVIFLDFLIFPLQQCKVPLCYIKFRAIKTMIADNPPMFGNDN